MTYKTIVLPNLALAVLGGLMISWLSLSPWLAFILGVLLSTLVVLSLCGSAVSSTGTSSNKDSSVESTHITLYVGNLPYKANEKDVRELFGQYGDVFDVRLMKDKRTKKKRGFGFVEMASKDADAAIAALADYEFMQRTLKVRLANEPKHGVEDEDNPQSC